MRQPHHTPLAINPAKHERRAAAAQADDGAVLTLDPLRHLFPDDVTVLLKHGPLYILPQQACDLAHAAPLSAQNAIRSRSNKDKYRPERDSSESTVRARPPRWDRQ
jgi:hypothetical protein